MKKKLLALSLALALCLGLLVLPAGAAPSLSAYEAVQLLDNYSLPGRVADSFPLDGRFFVDFDQDGIPEMVANYYSSRTGRGVLLVYYINNNGQVAKASGYTCGPYALDCGGINYGYGAGPSGKAIVGQFQNGTYGLTCEEDGFRWSNGSTTTFQYQGNGTFKKTSNKLTGFWTFDGNNTWPGKHAFFPQPVEPIAPPLPDVPAAPLGGGLTPAKAEAIEALKNVSYHGDRAAITMTADQASAMLGQMAWYASVTTNPSYPDAGEAFTYAALFDTGAGVPGLFMGKLYCLPGESPYVSGGQAVGYWGECAIWTFQNGQLTLFSPATYSLSYTLYPACVEQDNSAPDGSYTELRYFAMNYGSLSTTPANTVVKAEATASVDGVAISQSKADEFISAWRGAGWRAYATQGGGVEYTIGGMTPVAEMTAALEGFVAACAAPARTAYPSTQKVEVDGVSIPFPCYALKDANGNDTNYVKLRDIAYVLNGTAAQFAVDWDGAVRITTGKPYTPNNSEMSTPFSGQRTYTPASAETRVNGKAADLKAIVLTDDAGGAYTYYKLRDLGAALGFTVDWSAQKGIYIQTK